MYLYMGYSGMMEKKLDCTEIIGVASGLAIRV